MAIQQLPLPKTGIPSGNTAGRPASPAIGDTYYNGETTELEIYSSSGWVPAQKNWNQENNYVPASPNIGIATASASTNEATVTWSFNFNGGKSITAITITPYLNGTTAQTSQTAATGTATSHVFTGLTGGSNYTFTVKLTNSNGISAESVQSNSVTIVNTVTVEALVIAGGAGGGTADAAYFSAAGGGAGGYLYFPSLFLAGPSIPITVGAGGAAGSGNLSGTNGTSSRIGTTTLAVGGGGGSGSNASAGNSGGSGGGTVQLLAVGAGTSGQGFNGGQGNQGGGGGGGAGAVGGSGADPQGQGRPGGAGSNAHSSWATATSSGVSGFYAGGGGGGHTTYYLQPNQVIVNGGSGGGGTGGGSTTGTKALASTAGTANTGSGGGGGGGTSTADGFQPGRAGGSGIVIIRYSSDLPAFTSTTGSPDVYVTGGFRYYKFTGSGSVTV
jgi:hypothetical protein